MTSFQRNHYHLLYTSIRLFTAPISLFNKGTRLVGRDCYKTFQGVISSPRLIINSTHEGIFFQNYSPFPMHIDKAPPLPLFPPFDRGLRARMRLKRLVHADELSALPEKERWLIPTADALQPKLCCFRAKGRWVQS